MAKRKKQAPAEEEPPAKATKTTDAQTPSFRNKEKVLLLTSRGIPPRLALKLNEVLIPFCYWSLKSIGGAA